MIYGIMFKMVEMLYVEKKMGGKKKDKKGMKMMKIKIVRIEGGKVDKVIEIVNKVMLWGMNVVMKKMIMIEKMVIERKRKVNEMIIGKEVISQDR